MPQQCRYVGCELPRIGGQEFCLFHASKDKKGINNQEFNTKIRELFAQWQQDPPGLNNFEGFIFPSDIDLSGLGFRREANFAAAIFHGRVDFTGTAFNGDVVFDNAQFLHGVKFEHSIFKRKASFAKAAFILDKEDRPPDNMCADFADTTFKNIATFDQAQFANGVVTFLSAQFHGESADFNVAEFRACQTYFDQCEFVCKSIQFNNTVFAQSTKDDILNTHALSIVSMFKTRFGGQADFTQCRFEGTTSNFIRTSFEGGDIDFIGTKFHGGSTNFIGCRFAGGDTTFLKTEFLECSVVFEGCSFEGNVIFRNNKIAATLKFIELKLGEKSGFELRTPIFTRFEDQQPIIYFKDIRFNPFITFFDNLETGKEFIKDFESGNVLIHPIIIFRYCLLKDTFFSNSNMGIVSLFSSPFFEQAHFVSERWIYRRERVIGFIPLKFTRVCQIIEERLFDLIQNEELKGNHTSELRRQFGIELLFSHTGISDMYICMKTAMDRGKNYHHAGGFYFNEFEMKRFRYASLARSADNWGAWSRWKLRFYIYSIYKLFSGYGEKPMWSLSWFSLSLILFSALHLLNGLKILVANNEYAVIKYKLAVNSAGIKTLLTSEFWTNVIYSLAFALNRTVPTSYFPGLQFNISTNGLSAHDIFLQILNSIVLIFFLVLTGVGLKRHFRRF